MPYTCRVITRFDEQDMTRLLAMVDAAWRLDYQEDFRLDFSAGFMDRCTAQPGWFGVLVLDDSGAPIGWEIAMPRVLRTGAREFNAFYVTMFSVAPDHRRRGIGKQVLEGINEEAFGVRGADLIFSTFHGGHAGSPTVQATFDAAGLQVNRFQETPAFVLRFDRAELPESGEGLPMILAVSLEGDVVVDADAGRQLVNVSELDAAIAEAHEVSFRSTDLLGVFANPAVDTAKSYWLEFDDGAWCWVNATVNHLRYNEHAVGTSMQLQTLYGEGLTDVQVEQTIVALCRQWKAEKHLAAMAMNQTNMSPACLERIGFHADDQLYFAVRGSAEAVASFGNPSAPYFVDFT